MAGSEWPSRAPGWTAAIRARPRRRSTRNGHRGAVAQGGLTDQLSDDGDHQRTMTDADGR